MSVQKLCSSVAALKLDDEKSLDSQEGLSPLKKLEALATHYFYKTEEWQAGRKALARSYTEAANRDAEAFRQGVVAKIPQEDGGTFTWIVARDSHFKRYVITRSGRPWSMTRQNLERWVASKREWQKALPKEEPVFGKLVASPITMQILTRITAIYVESCRIYKDLESVSRFADFNKVRGDFAKLIVDLFHTRPPKEREFILQTLHKFFPSALSSQKWERLKKITGKEKIEQRDVVDIVFDGRSTPDELVAMAVSTIFCGEPKLGLDFCREIGKLTPEEREKLPPTLGERLQIYAYTSHPDETGRIARLPICEKCREIWPVVEALYWSLRKSGLNLTAIESV